ncbi:MAG: MerR family DNA-binding transcriptional regulator [Candidatus Vogelbacteria bacterium]|nr:MerR family DNA-binding transcriptional regulator [Candidatus Vogelbacteria bacterium]
MDSELLPIGETAKLLRVSIDTLRRWDKSGRLESLRESPAGHRYYWRQEIEAQEWVVRGSKISEAYYCSNSAVFQARLMTLQTKLEKVEDKNLREISPLIVAVAGEIGNNSFDHNLGNWPDVAGVFFGYNLSKRRIVLADRGQGVLKTLKQTLPELKNDDEALRVAFTKVISGRAPESRGNGLKFVREVMIKYPLRLTFRTGEAGLELKPGDKDLVIKKVKPAFRGCLAVIKF